VVAGQRARGSGGGPVIACWPWRRNDGTDQIDFAKGRAAEIRLGNNFNSLNAHGNHH
jgi:hypothetical protein